MIRLKLNQLATLCAVFIALYQPSIVVAAPVTSYVVTGTLFADLLEVTEFDEQTGEEISIDDAQLVNQPILLGASTTYTLRFSVDEGVEGDFPLFGPNVAFFNDAASDFSLDINGNNVLTDANTGRISQFAGTVDFFARWDWDLSTENLVLPTVEVFNPMTSEPIVDLTPQSLFFDLFDPTLQVYDGLPLDELIAPTNSLLSNRTFSILWGLNFDEEPDPDFEFDGEAFYQVFGTVDSITAVSAVPVPAAVWLFGSGLLGLIGVARR